MRAQTDIPFARAAAELLLGPAAVADELARVTSLRGSELRREHFAERYRSVDRALEASQLDRVLELAAGLSFRGLAFAQRGKGIYLDTDLPEVIATKQRLVRELVETPPPNLRLLAVDAFDAGAAVAELPAGALAIINEGLLVYLDTQEKERLAATIRDALVARGGVWITADIYIRGPRDPRVEQDDRLRTFLDAHRVDANKFESLAAAESLFTCAGFAIVDRAGGATRQTWVMRPSG